MRTCLAAFVLLIANLSGFAAGMDETQGFLDVEVRRRLSPHWHCFVTHESKVRDRDPVYFLWHLQAGARYEPEPWLGLALAQRYEDCRSSSTWLRESRTELDAVPRLELGRWTFSDRNRIEYRDFEARKTDRWRYRNELKAAHPLPLCPLAGYVSEEPQYDFETNRWSKHRVTAGLSGKLAGWLKVNVYYRWDLIEQSKCSGEWDTVQIFGVKLVVDTDRWVAP